MAAFADTVSPYYDFRAFACGIPSIKLEGEKSDWIKLRDSWANLGKLFYKTHKEYVERVYTLLDQIVYSFSDKQFWKNLYWWESCFCEETKVFGWYRTLYKDVPKYITDKLFKHNHISTLKYKCNEQDYEMKTGLFSSKLDGNFLVPTYSSMVFTPQLVVKDT